VVWLNLGSKFVIVLSFSLLFSSHLKVDSGRLYRVFVAAI